MIRISFEKPGLPGKCVMVDFKSVLATCCHQLICQVGGGQKRKNLDCSDWKQQALCGIWSPAENWEDSRELDWLGIQPQHRYWNISHSRMQFQT